MKTALVYDPTARFTHVAESLARDCNVLYAVQQHVGFPQPLDCLPGMGLKGISVISDPFEAADQADFAVFPDVGAGATQLAFRRLMPVFGSADASEIECDRWRLRALASKHGIDVPVGIEVQGINDLRKLLQKQSDVYVKLSNFRGATETFHHKKWVATEAKLNELATRLGPYADLAEFVVEQPIDDDEVVEVGFDTFYASGWPQTLGWGIEVKDACFAATIAPLPDRLQAEANKLALLLDEYAYKGPISTEYRVTEDKCYLIDVTARCGSPPSQLQSLSLENFADVCESVANDMIPAPEYIAPFGVQINLTSEQFQHGSLAVEVDDPDRVAIIGHCKLKGQSWAINTQASLVKNLTEFGAACGWGRTLESALEAALNAAEGVSGLYVSYNKGDLIKVTEEIRKAERLGLHWGRTHGKAV